MALTVAIQMDPIEKIDIGGDSTFALALEGAGPRPWPSLLRPARSFLPRRQGHRAGAGRFSVRAVKGDHFALGDALRL